ASKAKLLVYSPDRSILLHQLEAPLSLNPGESTQTAINFTLPALSTTGYGICHVDYELYNAENEIIQLPTESDSGRFSIYKIITPVTIKDAVYMWVTVKDENVYWGQDAEFTIHFKNTRSESRTLDINNPFFSIGHGGSEGPTFPSFKVILPPGEEYQHNVSLPTTQFNSYVKSSITVRIQYYDANGVLKQTGPGKTFFLLGPITNSTLKLNTLFKVVDTYYLYIDRFFQHNTNFKVSFGSLPQYSVNFGLSSGMLPQHSVNFTSSLGSLPEHSVKSVLPSGGLPQHNPNAASCPGTLPHHNLSSVLSTGSLPHHVVNSEFLSGSISQQHLNQFFSQNRIIPVFEIAGGLISC
ncbi:MAG: hypothetical protein L0Y76_03335, partial [Ignavibacteria bacterium]|nr:hypothetical protein [Ignavibacteria bacterium]